MTDRHADPAIRDEEQLRVVKNTDLDRYELWRGEQFIGFEGFPSPEKDLWRSGGPEHDRRGSSTPDSLLSDVPPLSRLHNLHRSTMITVDSSFEFDIQSSGSSTHSSASVG